MLVVANRKSDKENTIYHRCGCIYAGRTKLGNRKELSIEEAERKHYHACKYCSGLRGDVNVHMTALETWSRKRNMQFNYYKPSDTL